MGYLGKVCALPLVKPAFLLSQVCAFKSLRFFGGEIPTLLPEFNAAHTEVVNVGMKQNLYMCVCFMQLHLCNMQIIHMIQIEVRVPVYSACVCGDGAEQCFTPSHQVLSNLPHSSSSMTITTTTSGFSKVISSSVFPGPGRRLRGPCVGVRGSAAAACCLEIKSKGRPLAVS